MEERYRVNTPENISFSYDTAGIGSRFIAAFVDFLIYISTALALAMLTTVVENTISDPTLQSTITAFFLAFSFAFYWGYYILFELIWAGQSPGKRIAHIRVVRLDGTPASPSQIMIRNIARFVDLFPGFYGVGLLTMLFNDQSRRLGDFAAGTLVVREATKVTLQQVINDTDQRSLLIGHTSTEASTYPVHRLTQEQRQIVRSFIARRADMNDSQRNQLALQIGSIVAHQMDLSIPLLPAQAENVLTMIFNALDVK